MPNYNFGNKRISIKVTPEKRGSGLTLPAERQQAEERFDRMVALLRTALLSGYEVTLSAGSELIEAMIDLSLRLSEFFNKGGWRESKLNPDIEFLDKGEYGPVSRSNISEQGGHHTDELGNPKQKVTYIPGVWLQSDQLAAWFQDLSLAMAALKRESVNLDDFSKLLVPFRAAMEKTRRSRAVSSFHARQRRRRRK